VSQQHAIAGDDATLVRNAGFIRQWGKLHVLLPDESGVPAAGPPVFIRSSPKADRPSQNNWATNDNLVI
jgi:hypothetical protein